MENHEEKEGKLFRILHCEDDQGHAFIIDRLLAKQSSRIRVINVSDGKAGMEYLQNACELPDLILLDLNMPRMDGVEMLELLKEDSAFRTIPVVVLTTSKAEKDLVQASRNHVNGYIVKPLEYKELSEQLVSLCAYWLESDHHAKVV